MTPRDPGMGADDTHDTATINVREASERTATRGLAAASSSPFGIAQPVYGWCVAVAPVQGRRRAFACSSLLSLAAVCDLDCLTVLLMSAALKILKLLG